MPHPQDVAVPSLPEHVGLLGRIGDPIRPYAYSADQMRAYARAAVIADRAAGRASAEPESWRPIDTAPTQGTILLWWKNAGAVTGGFAIDENWTRKSKTPREGWKGDGDERIPRNQEDCTHWQLLRAPAGNPWPRFSDGRSTEEWLESQYAAPTPTASIAPKAEGEADENFVSRWTRVIRDMPSTYEHPAPPVAQAAAGALDSRHLNLLESCANWLESRSRCITLRIKVDPVEGGGYETLMRTYAEELRAIRAALSPRPEADADRASGGGV